jgi:hypothetical protein
MVVIISNVYVDMSFVIIVENNGLEKNVNALRLIQDLDNKD